MNNPTTASASPAATAPLFIDGIVQSWKVRILLFVFAVAPLGYFPFSEWIATTETGTSAFLWGQAVFVLPLLATPVLLVGLFIRRTRRVALLLLAVLVILLPSTIAGNVIGHRLRMDGMRDCAERSRPLVRAIEEYERDNGLPPGSLNTLVPKYLPAVPQTGMMAYPVYRYHTGADAEEQFAGNQWVLAIRTPSGGINYDRMLYFPKRNYNEYRFADDLELAGDWAYHHE